MSRWGFKPNVNDPLVLEVLKVVNDHIFEQKIAGKFVDLQGIALRAGYSKGIIYQMRRGNGPKLRTVDDILRTVGYKLKIARIDE
jgi:DNA-binding phage protein